MTRLLRARALAAVLAASSTLAAVAGTAAPAAAASAASAPHVSPYIRAARAHAQEASGPVTKLNPLMAHRPRVPNSLRGG
jgi:hypothetical protein